MSKKLLKIILILIPSFSYADCITVNGQVYCNNNQPSTQQFSVPSQQLYLPNIPYYPPPVQQPQVIIVPQITPGNPNFEKFEFDTGRVIKRN